MADFAPNFTARYRIRYTSLGKTHSTTWRLVNTVTDPSGVASKMGLFLADLAPNLYSDWTIVGADFALADSDVFLPAVEPANPTGAVSTGGAAGSDAAFQMGFVGRSTAGGRARFFIFGTNIAADVRDVVGNDFRVKSAELASISAAIVRLNETAPALVANDNHVATWYEYANMKYNDRWVRRLRRG
jgi:hypothetical protein